MLAHLKKWDGSSQLPGVIIYESVQLALFVIADTHKIKKRQFFKHVWFELSMMVTMLM